MYKYILFPILLIFFAFGVYYVYFNQTEKLTTTSLNISQAMSDNDTLFDKADKIRLFNFPEDHSSHNKFKLEWWYFTGNLVNSDGNEYSYQFTIFRNALSADSVELNSNFASNQLFFYHFAIADISENKFYFFDDYARNGAGLAGATSSPLKIWVNNSSIQGVLGDGNVIKEWKINAVSDKFKINFSLFPEKNIVLHGEAGLSQKSYSKGNASYYYSITRLRTIGTIQLLESGKEKKININGLSWLDREWSTTALSKEQVGWDWFSIQLNDSTELMYFKLRNKNGSADFAKGTLIYANGLTKKLYQSDLFIEEKSFWKNEKGDKYPSKWLLSIPSENIKLTIATKIPDQELKLNLRYYEGSIRINGFNGKCEVNGSGFVEMTGYSN